MTELLGSGLSFPLTVDRRGGIALATGEQDVDQAIEIILSTAPGERPMRPEFGCGVHDFVFDTIDAATVGRLETEVRAALDRWEPRIVGRGGRLRPLAHGRRPAADQHRLPAARHQPQAQPRLSLLRHPGGGRGASEPAPRHPARRPPLPGPRLRGAPAHHALVPGVDRAQRLRPRHHADRAVRVDDGDDDLPAQPRAGQAARHAARAARHPARRPERRRAPTCASGSSSRRPSRC